MTLWMFFAGVISGSPGEMIFSAVWNFGFGLLGLFLAWIRRVEA